MSRLLLKQHHSFQFFRTHRVQLLRVDDRVATWQFRRERECRQRGWSLRCRGRCGRFIGLLGASLLLLLMMFIWVESGLPSIRTISSFDEHLVTSRVDIGRRQDGHGYSTSEGYLLLDGRVFVLGVVVERRVDEHLLCTANNREMNIVCRNGIKSNGNKTLTLCATGASYKMKNVVHRTVVCLGKYKRFTQFSL